MKKTAKAIEMLKSALGKRPQRSHAHLPEARPSLTTMDGTRAPRIEDAILENVVRVVHDGHLDSSNLRLNGRRVRIIESVLPGHKLIREA